MADPATNAANFLAAHAVAAAEAFLSRAGDRHTLAHKAAEVLREADAISGAPANILVPVRLLAVAMGRCAASADASDARKARWADIVAALARLVRLESLDLRERT